MFGPSRSTSATAASGRRRQLVEHCFEAVDEELGVGGVDEALVVADLPGATVTVQLGHGAGSRITGDVDAHGDGQEAPGGQFGNGGEVGHPGDQLRRHGRPLHTGAVALADLVDGLTERDGRRTRRPPTAPPVPGNGATDA